jgi:hypothetical protein
MRLKAVALMSVLATATLGAQAAEQAGAAAPINFRSSTSKFFLTGGLNGSALKFDDSDVTESGSGATLGIGYGFSQRWAGFIEATGANIQSDDGDYTLAHFDIGARFHFANRARAWIPFLEGAFSGRAAMQEDVTICDVGCTTGDLTMSGTAMSFGGGVMFYPSPKLALTASLKWSVGEFSDVTFDNVTVSGFEADATSSRFGLGLVWFPQR